AGADQVLGGPGTAPGTGNDDDFQLKAGSPAIDDGNAYTGPFTDLVGQPRSDDPATANTGMGYPAYTQTDGGQAALTTGGTALGLRGTGGVMTYALPFAFSLYATAYTSVIVSSQGYLQFAGPNGNGFDTISQAGLQANVRIAPFWANFNTSTLSSDN